MRLLQQAIHFQAGDICKHARLELKNADTANQLYLLQSEGGEVDAAYAMGRIIHYPLLAGSAAGSFSPEIAAKVKGRMTALQDRISEGNWQELIPACQAAFPATELQPVKLPDDRFDTQLGCVELADFLRSALQDQSEYANELAEYRDFARKHETALASGLRSRVGESLPARHEERRKALAGIAKAGPPVAVLKECLARYR